MSDQITITDREIQIPIPIPIYIALQTHLHIPNGTQSLTSILEWYGMISTFVHFVVAYFTLKSLKANKF